MSGIPAFQATPNAFQSTAFQSGVAVVGGDYSLGSPIFATPTLIQNYAISVNTYWAGSPTFGTPFLGRLYQVLHANSYSLASPIFSTPSLRSFQNLAANSYTLGPPIYGSPTVIIGITQNHRLFANFFWLASPSIATPALTENYQFVAVPLDMPGYAWSPVGPVINNYQFHVDPYWTEGPKFGYPRLQTQVVEIGLPPPYLTQAEEAADMLRGLLDLLMASVPTEINDDTNNVRRLINALRANAEEAIRGDTLGTQLQEIYTAVDVAGGSYAGIEAARQYLMSQVASKSLFTQIVFRSALIMTLAIESTAITRMTFTTRDDAQLMIEHVRDMFEAAKAIGIDEVDVLVYQAVNSMGGTLVNYLASEALQLPRFVEYTATMPMPSLYLAQRIYRDPTRADEIEQENRVIHPAFCPITLRVLSNVGP